MSKNDAATTMASLTNAVRTLAGEGVTRVDVHDDSAELTLEGGPKVAVDLSGDDPSPDPSGDDPSGEDTHDDGHDEAPTTGDDPSGDDPEGVRCSCGESFDSLHAAKSHVGGKGGREAGHEVVSEGSDDPAGDDPEGSDDTNDDTNDDTQATGEALREAVDPEDVTRTFAKDNAEALTEGTGYDTTPTNAGKAVARTHGDWAATFDGQECATEGCDRVAPSWDPSPDETCPMHDGDDTSEGSDDTSEGSDDTTGGMTKADYEKALQDEGFEPAEAAAKAEARFGE